MKRVKQRTLAGLMRRGWAEKKNIKANSKSAVAIAKTLIFYAAGKTDDGDRARKCLNEMDVPVPVYSPGL